MAVERRSDEPASRSAAEQDDAAKQDDKAKEPARSWLRQVSFRSRISILVGAAVGIAVALAALVSYVAVGRQLERQATTNLDNAISSAAGLVHVGFPEPRPYSPPRVFNFQNQTGDSVQVITKTEVISLQSGQPSNSRFFPMTAGAAQVLKNGPDGNAIIENRYRHKRRRRTASPACRPRSLGSSSRSATRSPPSTIRSPSFA